MEDSRLRWTSEPSSNLPSSTARRPTSYQLERLRSVNYRTKPFGLMLRTSREQHQAAGQYGAMNAAPSVAPFAQSARLRCGRHESTKTSAGDSQSLISQIKTPQSRGQQRSRQIRSAAFFDMPQTRLRNLTVVVSRRTLRVLIDVTGGVGAIPPDSSLQIRPNHTSHTPRYS